MPTLTAEFASDQRTFAPGEPIDGLAGWDLEGKPRKWVEVRLFWATSGKGTPDAVIVDAVKFEDPADIDAQAFHFTAPEGPLSYEGRLIEIGWGVEVVAHKVREPARLECLLSTTGQPVQTA